MSDRLAVIFDLQAHAQRTSFGGDPSELPMPERITFIKDMILALEDELHEAMAEVSWKPWASSKFIKRETFIGELVDAQHFLINLCLAVDCTPQEFFARFIEKNTRNKERQAAGYDGIAGKCLVCNRAFDDVGVFCTISACTQGSTYGPRA